MVLLCSFFFRYALDHLLDFCRQVTLVSGKYLKLQKTAKFKRTNIVPYSAAKRLMITSGGSGAVWQTAPLPFRHAKYAVAVAGS